MSDSPAPRPPATPDVATAPADAEAPATGEKLPEPPLHKRVGAKPQALNLIFYLVIVVAGLVVGIFWNFPDTRALLDGIETPDIRVVTPQGRVVAEADTAGLAGVAPDSALQAAAATAAAAIVAIREGTPLDSLSAAQQGAISAVIKAAREGTPLDSLSAIEREQLNEKLQIPLMILVLLLGALGASLHGLTSLVEFTGNDQFEESWTLWYVARPFVGALLALVFYFVSRGIVDVVDMKDEFYGVLAVAGLIGLFSKQALYKLSDLFDVIFKSDRPDYLRDQLPHPVPTIDATEPAVLTVGVAEQTLRVIGSDFVKNTVLSVSGTSRGTSYVDGTTLETTLTTADLAAEGDLAVAAVNPAPGGGASRPFSVPIGPRPPATNAEAGAPEPPTTPGDLVVPDDEPEDGELP